MFRFLIDYLELYHIDHDQHSLFVMSSDGGGSRRIYQRLNTNDYEWQSRYHYKRRTNIVLSDMDTVHPCNRPLIRLLRIYCCEWGCQSVIFQKFQVNKSFNSTREISFDDFFFPLVYHCLLYFGCIC